MKKTVFIDPLKGPLVQNGRLLYCKMLIFLSGRNGILLLDNRLFNKRSRQERNCYKIVTNLNVMELCQQEEEGNINPLKTKRRLLYLKTQSVPRCKRFSSRLQEPIILCCKRHKSLFVLR
jgi:hypothetical protein